MFVSDVYVTRFINFGFATENILLAFMSNKLINKIRPSIGNSLQFRWEEI